MIWSGGGDTLPDSKMKNMSTVDNKYIIPAAAVLMAALALSCNKTQVEDSVYSSEEIVLNASPGETKGFLSTDALMVNGTQFRMFDYLSGYNGTLQDGGGVTHSGDEFKYFENTLTFKQDATNWQWLFGDVASPVSYRWTRTGTHHFYGWLIEDKTSTDPDAGELKSSSFFDTYTPGTKTLTVAKTFTAAGPQYDFLYSNVVPVDVIAGIPSHVDIPMKHLFGALGITVQNTSKVDVTVTSVRLLNFPNSHGEVLTWDMGSGVTLAGGNPTRSGAAGSDEFWPNKFSGVTLKKIEDANGGKTYDAYTGAEMGENLSYRLCWPMTQAALKPKVTGTSAEGNPEYSIDSPIIEIKAKEGSGSETTYRMRFPNADDDKPAISAGKKTQLNISFADKQIQLSFKTLPWDYEEFPMSYENDAVSATQLKFIEGTYEDGGKLTDANGKHDVIKLTAGSKPAWVARGKFSIYTPVNGRLSVGLSGDIDSFIVTLDSGDEYTGTGSDYILIDPSRNGGLITLGVRPKGSPSSGKKLFLHFAVTNNNRDVDADSEINRDNYVITIP